MAKAEADLFDWDDEKAQRNFRKHGVSFEEAQSVFGDDQTITIFDEEHSVSEDRFINIGLSGAGRLLVVIITDREDLIWIISARPANKREARQYAAKSPN